MDTFFLQVGKAHADAITRKKSLWLSQIGYLPFCPLNLDSDFTMRGLLYLITDPSEKKPPQLSISQDLAISSIFQQGSNTNQMFFCLSQTAPCHCIHCLVISFSCEWRKSSLVLSAGFISESCEGVCLLSEHRYKHLAESPPWSFYICLFSMSEKFWADAMDRKFIIVWSLKEEGKEHWRGVFAHM